MGCPTPPICCLFYTCYYRRRLPATLPGPEAEGQDTKIQLGRAAELVQLLCERQPFHPINTLLLLLFHSSVT